MKLSFLELADVLETSSLFALLLVFSVNLSIEKLCVGTALSHIDVILSRHFVLKLLLSASSHRYIELALSAKKHVF